MRDGERLELDSYELNQATRLVAVKSEGCLAGRSISVLRALLLL